MDGGEIGKTHQPPCFFRRTLNLDIDFHRRVQFPLSSNGLPDMMMPMYARDQAILATPIGTVRLIAVNGQLESLTIGSHLPLIDAQSPVLKLAEQQLKQWFDGSRRLFDIPLAPCSSTRAETLRQALIMIRYGETQSYGALAKTVGSGARAIGQACARNPLPIIVPCHRVLAAGGVLGAYSAGEGPVTKQWLLAHERQHCPVPDGEFDYTIA